MSFRTIRHYTFFIVLLGACAVFLGSSSAHAQSSMIRVVLDAQTLARGYQLASMDANMTITIQAHALSHSAVATIEKIADRKEAGQRFPIDAQHEFVSDIYVYDIAHTLPSDMRYPLFIDMKPSVITPWVSLFFFDRTSQQWKRLTTRVLSSVALRASSPLPFAPIAVLQEKKSIGAFSVSSLLAQTHAILVSDNIGVPLVAKNARVQSPPASITKLMTALVFLDHNPGWKKRITLQHSDDAQPARISFTAKETVTAYDLFMGMLVGSNNNAAKALARSTGLSEVAFVAAMNAKAARLKMYHTTFSDTSGLDPNNLSTVEDVVRLWFAAFKQKDIAAALAAKSYVIKGLSSSRTYLVKTTNTLLASSSIIKGKTGYIDESGYNFVGHAQGKKGRITVAVFGASTSAQRFDIVRQILKLVQ